MAMESHYFLVCDACESPGPFGGSCAHAEEVACEAGWEIKFLFREERGLAPIAFCPRCVARKGKPAAVFNPLLVNEFTAGEPVPTNVRKPVAPSTRLLLDEWKATAHQRRVA